MPFVWRTAKALNERLSSIFNTYSYSESLLNQINMKKLLASSGWLLLLVPFISFAGTKTLIGTVNHHTLSSETRKVSDFSQISSGGSFNVYVKMGSAESLRIEADRDELDNIETVVEGGVLKIKTKKSSVNWGWGSRSRVNIYITAKSLNGLAISGSGNMEVEGTIRTQRLDVKVSGSGNILLSTAAKTFNASLSGSGNIKVSGSTETSNVSISGSGEFEGGKLITNESQIKVSGSGEATVHANKTLNAAVSGSGDIFYSGNAQVNQSKSGSGKITRI